MAALDNLVGCKSTHPPPNRTLMRISSNYEELMLRLLAMEKHLDIKKECNQNATLGNSTLYLTRPLRNMYVYFQRSVDQ